MSDFYKHSCKNCGCKLRFQAVDTHLFLKRIEYHCTCGAINYIIHGFRDFGTLSDWLSPNGSYGTVAWAWQVNWRRVVNFVRGNTKRKIDDAVTHRSLAKFEAKNEPRE